jgi:metal-dependent HD superfamily phosphatase/phosphodiesterase
LSKVRIADGKSHKTQEAGAVALNQLIDIIQLRSRTLLSRKADDTRSVSGMHMSLDAVLLRRGYEPALELGKETAGFAE